jgi:hypothetical protein
MSNVYTELLSQCWWNIPVVHWYIRNSVFTDLYSLIHVFLVVWHQTLLLGKFVLFPFESRIYDFSINCHLV